ncbi:hypothetical protein [Absidia glauca]|uniref:Thc1 RRM domain-containing protein n=1 Tax=Absidia glauca TaxID=4829 RepID=A0A163ME14_ABSGL|nr:hypothetical protein [Absidia glauca]
MMDATSNKQTKRSSMLAYVPVHRRSDLPDQVQRSNQQRYSIDGQGNKRSSYGVDLNSNGARYSADFGGRSMQQQQRGWRRGQHNNGSSGGNSMDDEDYSEDNSFSSTPAAHRYSNYHSNRSSMSSYDPRMEKLGTMLENLSYDDPRHSAGPEEWDELLRQYDRSDEEAAILARKNKRASRVMDPFNEPPAQVPVVDEPTVILDCYDFPKSFKTHHLHDIFREYENIRGGYRIKWMDDTRALIIFEHPATAKKAYIDNVAHAYAKIRPFEGRPDFLSPSGTQSNRRSVNPSAMIPDPLM